MVKKVGIPRSLFYYKYYPLWKTFLEELGAEIILSDYTSKKIIDDGIKLCVDEACLPMKVFHGHVNYLKDKVDYLLIPRFTSVSKDEYVCPKFGGLPDMIRHTFKNLPQIIDTEVNLRKSKKNSYLAALKVGSYFSEDKQKIKKAYFKALKNYSIFRSTLKDGIIPSDILGKRKPIFKKYGEGILNIAVIGHVYNLYDNYVNMDMIFKLNSSGANVITIDMLENKIIDPKSNMLQKKMFWNFGRKAVGGTLQILDRGDIDGIIYLMSFGCGIDSFVADLVERRIRQNSNIPFIVLSIDEHSGEAGFNTRLEAFIDMIRFTQPQRYNSKKKIIST